MTKETTEALDRRKAKRETMADIFAAWRDTGFPERGPWLRSLRDAKNVSLAASD